MSHEKSPKSYRGVQIILGLIILPLSILVLVNPVLNTVIVIFILAIMLLLVGIEKIIGGIVIPGKSRYVHIGLGVVVVLISLLALVYPIGTSVVVAKVLGIALLVQGVSRIISGIRSKESSNWSRGFRIGVGIFAFASALVILNVPKVGLIYAEIFIVISLLVTSIQMISDGLTGEPKRRFSNKDKII